MASPENVKQKNGYIFSVSQEKTYSDSEGKRKSWKINHEKAVKEEDKAKLKENGSVGILKLHKKKESK